MDYDWNLKCVLKIQPFWQLWTNSKSSTHFPVKSAIKKVFNFSDCGYAQPPERRDGLACWVMVSSVPITLFSDGLSIKDARLSRRSTMHIMHGYHPIRSYGRKPFSLTFNTICTSVPVVSCLPCYMTFSLTEIISTQHC